MNIVVCIKQVPGSSRVDIDETTGVLKRDGAEAKMNPYDLFAIETARKIKEAVGGRITAVTMGPGQAEVMMREAFMMGVDEGVIFSDRKFAGADVLATAYTLSQGIQAMGDFDLIICGKQTTDGDTAQVGPAIAEYLDIPHAAWVSEITSVGAAEIEVEQELVNIVQRARMAYPCLITVEKDIYTPRLPSYRLKLDTRERPVHILTFTDFSDQDAAHYGLDGSATNVERIFPPEISSDQVYFEGSADEKIVALYWVLEEKKYVGGTLWQD